jgi:hypothetical protein
VKWIGVALVVLLALGGGAFAFYPRIYTGDYSDVTIETIAMTPGATCASTVEWKHHTSHGAVVNCVLEGERTEGVGEFVLAPYFPGWSREGSGRMSFSLNPEFSRDGTEIAPEVAKGRLLVRVGERHRMRLGERFYFYEFTGRNGKLYHGFFEVRR